MSTLEERMQQMLQERFDEVLDALERGTDIRVEAGTIFKPSDTPETDPTPSPDTPPRGTRPNQKEIA